MNFQIVVKENDRPSPGNTPENCKCVLYIKIMQDYKTLFEIDFKGFGEFLQVSLQTLHRPRKIRRQWQKVFLSDLPYNLLRLSCYDIVLFKLNTYIMNWYPWYSSQSRTNSERSSGRNGDKKTNGKRNTIPKRLDILLSSSHGLIDN